MPKSLSRSFPTDIFSRLWWEQLTSDTVRLLVFGLIADADDMGRGEYSHSRIAHATTISGSKVKAAIKELENAGLYNAPRKSDKNRLAWKV